MSVQCEMSLTQYLGQLLPSHRARREFDALKANLAEAKRLLREAGTVDGWNELVEEFLMREEPKEMGR